MDGTVSQVTQKSLISNNHAGFPLQKQLKTVDNKSIISLNLW